MYRLFFFVIFWSSTIGWNLRRFFFLRIQHFHWRTCSDFTSQKLTTQLMAKYNIPSNKNWQRSSNHVINIQPVFWRAWTDERECVLLSQLIPTVQLGYSNAPSLLWSASNAFHILAHMRFFLSFSLYRSLSLRKLYSLKKFSKGLQN